MLHKKKFTAYEPTFLLAFIFKCSPIFKITNYVNVLFFPVNPRNVTHINQTDISDEGNHSEACTKTRKITDGEGQKAFVNEMSNSLVCTKLTVGFLYP